MVSRVAAGTGSGNALTCTNTPGNRTGAATDTTRQSRKKSPAVKNFVLSSIAEGGYGCR